MEEAVLEAENLLRPREVVEKTKDQEEKEEEEKKGANSEILNNMISNFMGATTTIDGKSGENVQKFECEDEDEKKRESSGAAGILEKIISHLPGTLLVYHKRGLHILSCSEKNSEQVRCGGTVVSALVGPFDGTRC